MATTITINQVLVGTGGITVARNLPAKVQNLDIQITSSDWTTLSGSVDFLIEVLINGTWYTAVESTDNELGRLSPKGNGLPHFFAGSDFLDPATRIRITATPTTPVHLGLVVVVNAPDGGA